MWEQSGEQDEDCRGDEGNDPELERDVDLEMPVGEDEDTGHQDERDDGRGDGRADNAEGRDEGIVKCCGSDETDAGDVHWDHDQSRAGNGKSEDIEYRQKPVTDGENAH